LQHLALLATLRGNGRAGARLVGYVNRQFDELGLQREMTEAWGYDRLASALRAQLGEAEVAELGQLGASWQEDRAVQEALSS
jgi:hypothetical protein